MRLDGVAAAIQDVASQFETVVANTDGELHEAFRLRYQVYCLERGFEAGKEGHETDEYDRMSHHVLLRHRATREVVGTVRLITPVLAGCAVPLPMELVADTPPLRFLPRRQVAEVSRFAMSKCQRAANGNLGSLQRMALIRGILRLSDDLGLTHWCALMEPKLLRLLRMTAICFDPIGGVVEHHGVRQPSLIKLGDMLDRVRREQRGIWEFLTDGGALTWEDRLVDAA